MKKLGFIAVNDESTLTLVNRKTKSVEMFESFPSVDSLLDRILYNHYRLDGKGHLSKIKYGKTIIHTDGYYVDESTPPKVHDIVHNPIILKSILDVLLLGETEETVLKFLCDIYNLKQRNVFASELYKTYKLYYPVSKYVIQDVRQVTMSRLDPTFKELYTFMAPKYHHQWVFTTVK